MSASPDTRPTTEGQRALHIAGASYGIAGLGGAIFGGLLAFDGEPALGVGLIVAGILALLIGLLYLGQAGGAPVYYRVHGGDLDE